MRKKRGRSDKEKRKGPREEEGLQKVGEYAKGT